MGDASASVSGDPVEIRRVSGRPPEATTPLLEPEARRIDPAGTPDAARSLDTLATLLIVVIVIAILYLARDILVPIAIAVLLSFVLSPLVKLLRSIGVGKSFSVGIVVLATFLIAVGLGVILAKQISDLAADAPKYQATVAQKASGLRDFAANNPLLGKLEWMIADVSRISPPDRPKPTTTPATGPTPPAAPKPTQVEIVSPAPGVLTILQAVAGTAASPLATAAFVAIFIVFILLQREDLRNRFIRLFGFGDIQRTTLAMNDAARRLSRYLLAQVLLNTGFGLVVATALAVIGVPSAILWGIVAIFMRFIPYIGSLGAAVFPIAMAAAAGTGWTMAIETAILFAVAELVTGQVIEPLVYGRNTGISPIAVVASATFWTWLWGPVGLVLSTPLTVCLVVMGRHVDRLTFLDVLLGDAPPLTPIETFYQRVLAGDPSEIADHAETYLRDHSLVDYCDQVALRALLRAQVDVRSGALEEKRQTRIRDTMRGLVADLASEDASITPGEPPAALDEREPPAAETRTEPAPAINEAWRRDGAVLCVAGRTPLDEAAAALLVDLLGQHGIGTGLQPAEILTTSRVGTLAPPNVKLVVLSFLDADLRLAQARFAVRRLRRTLPDVPIVSAFWMGEADTARTTGLCSDVRCDACVSNLPDAIALCLDYAGGKAPLEAAPPRS